jgi:hypothetical protein
MKETITAWIIQTEVGTLYFFEALKYYFLTLDMDRNFFFEKEQWLVFFGTW